MLGKEGNGPNVINVAQFAVKMIIAPAVWKGAEIKVDGQPAFTPWSVKKITCTMQSTWDNGDKYRVIKY